MSEDFKTLNEAYKHHLPAPDQSLQANIQKSKEIEKYVHENIERRTQEMESNLLRKMGKSHLDFNTIRYPAYSSRYLEER